MNRIETNTESNKKKKKRKREALEFYPFQHEVDYLRLKNILSLTYLEVKQVKIQIQAQQKQFNMIF